MLICAVYSTNTGNIFSRHIKGWGLIEPRKEDNFAYDIFEPDLCTTKTISTLYDICFQEALNVLDATDIGKKIIENFNRVQLRLNETFLNSPYPISARITEVTRGGSINMCTSLTFEEWKSKIIEYYNGNLHNIIIFNTRLLSNTKSGSKPDWFADKKLYNYHTSFIHHNLTSAEVGMIETLEDESFYFCNKLENFRFMFLLILESPDSKDVFHENNIMDYLFKKKLFGLPVYPFGIIIPLLTMDALCYYENKYGSQALREVCALIMPSDNQYNTHKHYLKLSIFLKILLLTRMSEFTNIIQSSIKNNNSSFSTKRDYDDKVSLAMLITYWTTCLHGYNIFQALENNERIEDCRPCLENRLVDIYKRQAFESWQLFCQTIEIYMTNETNTKLLSPKLGRLCGDANNLIPSEWIEQLSSITLKASSQFSNRLKIYDNQRNPWLEPTDDKNWSARLHWFALILEKESDPLVMHSYGNKDEYEYRIQQLPYVLFVLLPGQLKAMLKRAVEIYSQTKNITMINEWLLLIRDVFEVLIKIIYRGMPQLLKRGRVNFGDKWWNGKGWTDQFHYELSLGPQWCGFQLVDSNITHFTPKVLLITALKSFKQDLVQNGFLTKLENSELNEEFQFYIDIFCGKINISKGLKLPNVNLSIIFKLKNDEGYIPDEESENELKILTKSKLDQCHRSTNTNSNIKMFYDQISPMAITDDCNRTNLDMIAETFEMFWNRSAKDPRKRTACNPEMHVSCQIDPYKTFQQDTCSEKDYQIENVNTKYKDDSKCKINSIQNEWEEDKSFTDPDALTTLTDHSADFEETRT